MTIREIAAIAGVSPAAVSLVINNKKGVGEKTRQHILDVINSNGYSVAHRKEEAARFRLMVIKYRLNGVALEENQGFILSIIDQIESECHRYAYDLVMCNCNAENAEQTLYSLMSNPPDAVILIGTELQKADYRLLSMIPVPFVVLDNNINYENVDCIVMSNATLMEKMVQYLFDCGFRDIGYFRFNCAVNNCNERYEGYLEALRKLGLPQGETIALTPTLNGAYDDMKALLSSGKYKPHGAVCADNDTVAIGAMKALQEAGYSIPGDISLTGFDDIPFSAMTSPALTTMRISRTAMGTLAVDLIRKRSQHPDWPGIHIHIGGKLVERGTSEKLS